MPLLDDAQLYRALAARDTRFDGLFFVGVTSTGIYCRPVCPAPLPRRDRCRFYPSAAAAERRGFRPCLRCRPELAPGDPFADGTPGMGTPGMGTSGIGASSVDATDRLARAAARRIAAGALDRDGLDALATELGVTARHLRRAVERRLGATPVELAQTQRLLTAKQLLTETELPVTRVALAAGFRSVRRFNALFQERYRMAPTALRRGARAGGTTHPGTEGAAGDGAGTISLSLAYRPPYDWGSMLAYLALRATPEVETVTADGRYRRAVALHGAQGIVTVGPGPAAAGRRASPLRARALALEVDASLLPVLVPLVARLRRLLDLDADPQAVAAQLGTDPTLAPLVARRPGLRVPGAFSGFELALRTVLGQQVSVRGATTLAGRLASRLGEPLAEPREGTTRLPVTAERLADAGVGLVAGIGLPRARAECAIAIARAVVAGELPWLADDGAAPRDPAAFVRRFTRLPGIGPWTASYVAMRALRWPDAFPEGDLALRKAMGGLTPARLRAAAERWRPWRAYAAQHLWAGLDDGSAGAVVNY